MSEKDELAALRRMAELEAKSQPEKTGGFMSGMGMGALDPIGGITQMAPRGISALTSLGGLAPNRVSEFYDQDAQRMDQVVKQREQNYEQNRSSDGFDWGRLVGNILSPVNLAGASAVGRTGQAVSTLGKAVPTLASKAATVGKSLLAGGAVGATAPVTDTDNFASEKLKQIGFGAAGSAIAPQVGKALGKALSPQTDDAVKALLKEGVDLTPGQIAGGWTKGVEDKLTSVPFVGDIIKGAQKRSFESLNKAAINRALEPIGKALPKDIKMGRDAIGFVDDALGRAYDDLLPKLTGKIDEQFSADLDNMAQMVTDDFIMSDSSKAQFSKIVDGLVKNRISKTGSITGQGVKEIESQLGELTKKLGKSSDLSDNQLSDALQEVQSSLRGMLQRNNPEHAKQLTAINKGWANFKRVQKAAASVGNDEGVFTPAQLQNSVKALDRSKDKGAFARGDALMQDLSDAAKSKLPSSIPNSGTTDRAALLATGLFGLGSSTISPTLALPATASAFYTPWGTKAAQALLTKRPDAVRNLGNAASKYAQYLGAPLGVPLANQ